MAQSLAPGQGVLKLERNEVVFGQRFLEVLSLQVEAWVAVLGLRISLLHLVLLVRQVLEGLAHGVYLSSQRFDFAFELFDLELLLARGFLALFLHRLDDRFIVADRCLQIKQVVMALLGLKPRCVDLGLALHFFVVVVSKSFV